MSQKRTAVVISSGHICIESHTEIAEWSKIIITGYANVVSNNRSLKGKVKVKFAIEQAAKGQRCMGSIALSFL